MLDAFKRRHCGFFDAYQLPYGGPDPNPDLRPNGQPRRPVNRKRRSDADDFTNEYGELIQYNKNEPSLGLEQITNAYKKWAEYYISECWGQRKHKLQAKRMDRWAWHLFHKLTSNNFRPDGYEEKPIEPIQVILSEYE